MQKSKTVSGNLETELNMLYTVLRQQKYQHEKEREFFTKQFQSFRRNYELKLHQMQKYFCLQFIRFFTNDIQRKQQIQIVEKRLIDADAFYEKLGDFRQQIEELKLQNKKLQDEIQDKNNQINTQAITLREKDKYITSLELIIDQFRREGGRSRTTEVNSSEQNIARCPSSSELSSRGSISRSRRRTLTSQFNASRSQLRSSIANQSYGNIMQLQASTYAYDQSRTVNNSITEAPRYYGGTGQSNIVFNKSMKNQMVGDEYDHQSIEITIAEDDFSAKLTKNSTIPEGPEKRLIIPGFHDNFTTYHQQQYKRDSMSNYSASMPKNDSNLIRLSQSQEHFNENFVLQELSDQGTSFIAPMSGQIQTIAGSDAQSLINKNSAFDQRKFNQNECITSFAQQILKNLEIQPGDPVYVGMILPWMFDLEQSHTLLIKRYCELEEIIKLLHSEKSQILRNFIQQREQSNLLKQQIQKLKTEHEVYTHQMQQELQSSNNNYAQLSQDFHDLQTKQLGYDSHQKQCQIQIMNLESQIKVLNEQIAFSNNKINNLLGENTRLKKKITEQSTAPVSRTSSRLDTKMLGDLNDQIEINVLNAKVEKQQTVIAIQKMEIETLNKQIQDLNFHNNELQSELNRKFHKQYIYNGKENNIVDSLRQQLDFSQNQLHKYLEDINTKNHQLELLENQLNDLNKQFIQKEQDIVVLKRRIITMNDKQKRNEESITKYTQMSKDMLEKCYMVIQEKEQIIGQLQLSDTQKSTIARQKLAQKQQQQQQQDASAQVASSQPQHQLAKYSQVNDQPEESTEQSKNSPTTNGQWKLSPASSPYIVRKFNQESPILTGKKSGLQSSDVNQEQKYHLQLQSTADGGISRTNSVILTTENNQLHQNEQNNVWERITSNQFLYSLQDLYKDKIQLDKIEDMIIIEGDKKIDEFLTQIDKETSIVQVENKRIQTETFQRQVQFIDDYCQTEETGKSVQMQTIETAFSLTKKFEDLENRNDYLEQQLQIYQESKIANELNQMKSYQQFQQKQQQAQETIKMMKEDVFGHRLQNQKLVLWKQNHKCPTIESFQNEIEQEVQKQQNAYLEMRKQHDIEIEKDILNKNQNIQQLQAINQQLVEQVTNFIQKDVKNSKLKQQQAINNRIQRVVDLLELINQKMSVAKQQAKQQNVLIAILKNVVDNNGLQQVNIVQGQQKHHQKSHIISKSKIHQQQKKSDEQIQNSTNDETIYNISNAGPQESLQSAEQASSQHGDESQQNQQNNENINQNERQNDQHAYNSQHFEKHLDNEAKQGKSQNVQNSETNVQNHQESINTPQNISRALDDFSELARSITEKSLDKSVELIAREIANGSYSREIQAALERIRPSSSLSGNQIGTGTLSAPYTRPTSGVRYLIDSRSNDEVQEESFEEENQENSDINDVQILQDSESVTRQYRQHRFGQSGEDDDNRTSHDGQTILDCQNNRVRRPKRVSRTTRTTRTSQNDSDFPEGIIKFVQCEILSTCEYDQLRIQLEAATEALVEHQKTIQNLQNELEQLTEFRNKLNENLRLRRELEQLKRLTKNQKLFISDLETEIFALRNENRVAQANLQLLFGQQNPQNSIISDAVKKKWRIRPNSAMIQINENQQLIDDRKAQVLVNRQQSVQKRQRNQMDDIQVRGPYGQMEERKIGNWGRRKSKQ